MVPSPVFDHRYFKIQVRERPRSHDSLWRIRMARARAKAAFDDDVGLFAYPSAETFVKAEASACAWHADRSAGVEQ